MPGVSNPFNMVAESRYVKNLWGNESVRCILVSPFQSD